MVHLQRARFLPRQPSFRRVRGRNVSPSNKFFSRINKKTYISLYRPFFDKITIDLPAAKTPLVITASGAPLKPYVNSVTVNGRELAVPILAHRDIASGGHIDFRMSSTPQSWGSGTLVRPSSDVATL